MSDYKKIIDKELEDMTFNEVKNRRSINLKTRKKGIAVITAAVCAAMLCGITAAALGYLDFETIFGDFIKLDNSELADSLVGTISDVKYKVSDNDYKITVKGAAGDKYNVVAVAEISRKDGTPVTEHLKNPVSGDHLSVLLEDVGISKPFNNDFRLSSSFRAYINDDGNIEFLMKAKGSDLIDGCRVKAYGENFYSGDTITAFRSENKVFYEYRNGRLGWYQFDENGYATDIPAKVDDSSIILLDLEWKLSFKYNVSETAPEKKVCTESEEPFIYYQCITVNETAEQIENTASLISAEADAMEVHLDFRFPMSAEQKSRHGSIKSGTNDIYLIKKDGTHIVLTEESCSSGWGRDEIVECKMSLSYTEDYSLNILTEIEDVTSIYINGTIYELNCNYQIPPP